MGGPADWFFGLGNEIVDELFFECPRRFTLMPNLAVLAFATNPLCDDHYFNDAFLRTGPIDNSGSNFGQIVCEIIHGGMDPFRDEELVHFVRKSLYPSPKSQAILGLPLARNVCICAPLFDSIPPFAENGEARLPVALVPVDEEWLEEFQLNEAEYTFLGRVFCLSRRF